VQRARCGSLRASALVLFTAVMPAVALVGPNTIYAWIFPAVEEVSFVAAASSEALSPSPQVHMVEHPSVLEAASAPQLSPATSEGFARPVVAAAIDVTEPVGNAELRFRESSPVA